MNATRTAITASMLQKIGNIAAYSFWISSALVAIGFVSILLSYDSPAAYAVGQLFAAVATAMVISIMAMVGCAGVLRQRGQF